MLEAACTRYQVWRQPRDKLNVAPIGQSRSLLLTTVVAESTLSRRGFFITPAKVYASLCISSPVIAGAAVPGTVIYTRYSSRSKRTPPLACVCTLVCLSAQSVPRRLCSFVGAKSFADRLRHVSGGRDVHHAQVQPGDGQAAHEGPGGSSHLR